jgi:hypothetical protein
MAYFGRSLGSTVLLCLMMGIFFSLIGALMLIKKPLTSLVIASSFQHNKHENTVQPATKVVSIKNEAAVAEQ